MMTTTTKTLLLAASLLALVAIARADSLWKPEPMSAAARRLVHDRMKDHGREMEQLLWDVLFLDYDGIKRSGATIARNASPLDRHAIELEPHVFFFTMQNQLKARALNLVEAASAQDGQNVSKAFGQLSETCVHCHIVYLEPSPVKRRRPTP